MADQVSIEVIKAINARWRPLAEEIRALEARFLEAKKKRDSGLEQLVPKTDEVIDDGRAADGVAQVTGNELLTFFALMDDLEPLLEKIGSQNIIEKLCVRPLEIS